MHDSLQALVRDTLSCLKDPLFPRQTLFATVEECILFQRKPKERQAAPALAAPLPQTPPRPYFREAVAPPPAPKGAVSPPQEIPKPAAPAAKAYIKPEETDSSDQIKKTLQKIAPGIRLTEAIPDDGEAKKIAGAYRDQFPGVEVVLLACLQEEGTLEFLKGLGRAIDQHLGKTKILPAEKIEQDNRWDLFLQKNTFRLIIASEGMQQLPRLMQFYRSAGQQPFLDKIPLLPLSSSVLYKSIEHKAHLWKTLCQMLRK